MKQTLLVVAVASAFIGFGLGVFWTPHRQKAPPTTEVPAMQAEELPESVGLVPAPAPSRPSQPPLEPTQTAAPRSFEDILNELAGIQVTPGPGQGRAQYRILGLLDQLAQGGSGALPSIRNFLASGRDIAYPGGRGQAGMLPPSLRFGLFDVVRQIGGMDAQEILAESLAATTQGTEFAYLTQLLESMAPESHRASILAAAHRLLGSGSVTDPAGRNAVYDVLRQFKDASCVPMAQANLVQADGKVDRSALRYLQQTLGDASLTLATQTFQDQRIVDAESKEALGRLALTFVGANDQALELYHKAALDPQLTPGQRRNLIEDLNQDGLVNRRDPTPEDVKVIAKRYELTQAYLQQEYVQNDKLLNDAFREADKDLRNLLQRAGALPEPAPAKP